MARMTKEQREELEVKRRREQEEQETRDYPGLLQEALTLATRANFEIEFRSGNFSVRDRDNSRYQPMVFGLTYDKKSIKDVLELISDADYKLRVLEERAKKQEMKDNALAKLTPEERKALGV